jgi:hypothetical protein
VPAALTYASLITDLQAYTNRGYTSDAVVAAQLPRLINRAERAIAIKLQIEGFQKPVTTTLTPGTNVLAKPDRWRRTVSISIGTGAALNTRVQLFPRSYETLRAFSPDDSVTAQPQYYAEYDYYNWVFAPTPDLAYPIEVLYYEQPELLDTTNQTNWLTEIAPTALLYGCLLQCAPFLDNDERVPTWKGMYEEALSDFNMNDMKKMIDRTTTRQGA